MTAPVSDRHSADTVYRRRWAILGVLSLSVFLAVVDNTIVNVALPRMSEELKASTSQLQWIVDAYSLVFAGLLLVGGSLGDRYGRKGALQFGVGAFAGFSLFAALSGSTHVLIAARALMGLAAAFIFPATLAILTNTFTDAKERAAAIGVWTGVVGLAVALGPLSGGALLQHFWWGSIFFVNLPVAAVAMALGAWLIPKTKDPAAPTLDLLGFVLSIVGIVAVVYTTIEAPGRGWTNPATVGGYVGGAAVLALFALWERRTSQPMLDVDLFRNIRFSAASFSITVSFFALFGYIFLITQYFQLVRGYDTLSAGVHTMVAAPSTDAILAVLPPAKAGVGSAVNDVTRELGGAFGVAVVGAVFSSVYGPHLIGRLAGIGLPGPALAAARESTAAALGVASQAPPQVRQAIVDAARSSFVDGFSRGSLVCSGVVVAGAIFAFLVLPTRLPAVAPPPVNPAPAPGSRRSGRGSSAT